jgi:mannose-6-phosphate isomerase
MQLWMGTHPSLPSKDLETQRSLLDLVQINQALMTTEITERYGGKLPFLFKVLSINKALSIQAHPNKKLAEQLHAKDPKNYPGRIYRLAAHRQSILLMHDQMTTTSPK